MSLRLFRAGAAAIIVVLVATILSVLPEGKAANAANAWDFNPGEIVSDTAFYNSGTMSAGQIQTFLQSKVKSCRSGYTCLKDYRQDTWSRAADPMCGAFQGARWESAADIIAKVGKACGINPQTLLVLLEKEQSLVTDDFPTAEQYRKSTGYACPDTAPCDATYNGFYNQLYMAAWAFKRYAMPAGTGPGTEWYTRYDRMYPVGETSAIQYNPDRNCGTKNVYVRNQATHALYVYTPYVPNDSALAAGYGRGDNCGAYGNRNFFLLFSDWFGSPAQFETRGWIGDKFKAIGGFSGPIGGPTGNEQAVADGAIQQFQGGAIYCSIDGAFVVRGWIRDRYVTIGANGSVLGWPVADEATISGGASQRFKNGTIYASRLGAFAVTADVDKEYGARQGPAGALGFPVADSNRVGSGSFQRFENGALSVSGAGTWVTRGWIGDKYLSLGGPSSWLGWPVGNERTAPGGAVQLFEKGAIITTSAGAFATSKEIAAQYATDRGPASVAGDPTGDAVVAPDGAVQRFQGGTYFSSSAGVWLSRGWIGDRYRTSGEQAGALKWPVGNETTLTGGALQRFQGGTVYAWTGGAFSVVGNIDGKYTKAGANDGALRFPTEEAKSLNGGRTQSFQGGAIADSSAGTWILRGWIGDKYRALGSTQSPLGWPSSDEKTLTGGAVQSFTGGSIYASSTGAFELRGAIGSTWTARGGLGGVLGFPTSDELPVAGGVEQRFQGGSLVNSGAGTFVVRGWIGDRYRANGGTSGPLGFPRNDERALPGGAQQDYTGGSVISSAAGAYAVRGWIGDRYVALGGAGGRLGFPLGDEYLAGGDHVQQFQNGRIVVNGSGTSVYYN